MSKHLRSVLLIIAVFVLVFLVVSHLVATTDDSVHLDYGAFYRDLQIGQVGSFHAVGSEVTGALTNGTKYVVSIPNTDSAFVNDVMHHVRSGAVSFEQPTNTGILSMLLTLTPFLLMALLLIFLLRQAQPAAARRSRSGARAPSCSRRTGPR